LGQEPYPSITSVPKLLVFLDAEEDAKPNNRPPAPDSCKIGAGRELWTDIIWPSFSTTPSERPSFKRIHERIRQICSNHHGYEEDEVKITAKKKIELFNELHKNASGHYDDVTGRLFDREPSADAKALIHSLAAAKTDEEGQERALKIVKHIEQVSLAKDAKDRSLADRVQDSVEAVGSGELQKQLGNYMELYRKKSLKLKEGDEPKAAEIYFKNAELAHAEKVLGEHMTRDDDLNTGLPNFLHCLESDISRSPSSASLSSVKNYEELKLNEKGREGHKRFFNRFRLTIKSRLNAAINVRATGTQNQSKPAKFFSAMSNFLGIIPVIGDAVGLVFHLVAEGIDRKRELQEKRLADAIIDANKEQIEHPEGAIATRCAMNLIANPSNDGFFAGLREGDGIDTKVKSMIKAINNDGINGWLSRKMVDPDLEALGSTPDIGHIIDCLTEVIQAVLDDIRSGKKLKKKRLSTEEQGDLAVGPELEDEDLEGDDMGYLDIL
jgi:hypothetical protein